MGWFFEIEGNLPESFLIKIFEKVYPIRFTDKIKFKEIMGGYGFFDISIPVSPVYSITERIQLKTFKVKNFEYANIPFPVIDGDCGMSSQGTIFYRFTEESKGAITRCLQFKQY